MRTPTDPDRGAGLDVARAGAGGDERPDGDFCVVTSGPKETTVVLTGRATDAPELGDVVATTVVSFARYTDDPRELLSLANGAVLAHAASGSVVAVCAVFDPKQARLCWASAGRAPRALPHGRLLGATPGAALGVAKEPALETGEEHLLPGTGLLLTSSDPYDDDAAAAIVAGLRGGTAQAVADGVAKECAEHLRPVHVVVLRGSTADPAPSRGAAARERQRAAGGFGTA